MATVTVTAPAKIRVENLDASISKTFMPYKENFTVGLQAGKALEFEVKTSGQVLYYLGQATDGLNVSVINSYTSDANTIKLNVPAKVTITNSADRSIGFVPYRENFTTYVSANDSVEITTTNVGQVLYYLSQITDGLSVTQEAVSD